MRDCGREARRVHWQAHQRSLIWLSMIAQEVVSGIDEAVSYWLNRIEQELGDRGLSAEQQLRGIELVIREYKEVTGNLPFRCAEA